tara:strand:- start:107 stop:253 length:147 start_codon:yes stop_codon:yes gene_type:complete
MLFCDPIFEVVEKIFVFVVSMTEVLILCVLVVGATLVVVDGAFARGIS